MASRNVHGDSKVRVKASALKARGRYTIQLNNLVTGESKTFQANSIAGKLQKTVAFRGSGVTTTIIKDSKGRVVKQSSQVGTAEIDCCIAKLVHDAINCTCKCDQCKKDLRRAQTIRLLIDAAKYDATEGLAEGAVEKYNKAKSMCVEVCACGC